MHPAPPGALAVEDAVISRRRGFATVSSPPSRSTRCVGRVSRPDSWRAWRKQCSCDQRENIVAASSAVLHRKGLIGLVRSQRPDPA